MSNRSNRWIHGLVLAGAMTLALGAAGEGAALADKCNEDANADASGGKKKNYRTVIGPDGRKVFVIEKAFVVCGKVPKPNVIYVLQASNINYEWETLKQDFLPKVLDSVRKAPF